MKRILLGIFAFTVIGTSSAQIEIKVDGIGPDVSGTVIDINVSQFDSVPYGISMYVTNNTGSDQEWQITRVLENVPAMWEDQVCWPPSCFPASGTIYSTPNTPGSPAPTIVNGSDTTTTGFDAIIKPLIVPDGMNGVAFYMYYITSGEGVYVDSVGVRYNYVLDVEENKPQPSVSIAPNPANNYVSIQTTGVENGTIKVVDVLGNAVLTEKITGSTKTLNTESFRNGIYFVRIEAPGIKTYNRKLIVRH